LLTLQVLTENLHAISADNTLEFENCLAFFSDIKNAQPDIHNALMTAPDASALKKFRNAFAGLLVRFRDEHADTLARHLDQQGIRTLCNALAVCASPTAGLLFTEAQSGSLRPVLQQLTDTLLSRAGKLGLWYGHGNASMTLDILNWASRALKSRLIDASPSLRDAFASSLALFEEWADTTKSEATSALVQPKRIPFLSARQIGKCAVQLNTMLRFRLVPLDGGHGQIHHEQIAACARKLCSPMALELLAKRPVDAVIVINISNLIKDLFEARLPYATDEKLLHASAGLAHAISGIEPANLLQNDCRILSNCCNYIRTIEEHGLTMQAGFAKCLPQWDAACDALAQCVKSDAFARAVPSAQAVANLLGFIKSRCRRQVERESGAGAAQSAASPKALAAKREALRLAASHLTAHLLALGEAELQSTETLAGLLSGLNFLLASGLAEHTDETAGFIAQAISLLGRDTASTVSDEERRALLPALIGLLRAGMMTQEQAQPVMRRLLGNARTTYALEDLLRECRARGVEEEAALAMAPSASSASTTSSSSTTTTQSRGSTPKEAARRPGDTKIVADPRLAAVPASTNAPRLHAPARARAPQDWTKVKKGARPGQTAPAEVRVPAAEVRVPAAEAEEADLEEATSETTVTTTTTTTTAFATSKSATANTRAGAASPPARATQAGAKANKPKQAGNASTKGQRKARPNPKVEWFLLLKSGGSLDRLKQLAADPAVLNAQEGDEYQPRGALFHALVRGRKDVVAWLMSSKTKYRLEQEPHALLIAACNAMEAVAHEHIAAIECLVDSLKVDARRRLREDLENRQPGHAEVVALLKNKGFVVTKQGQTGEGEGEDDGADEIEIDEFEFRLGDEDTIYAVEPRESSEESGKRRFSMKGYLNMKNLLKKAEGSVLPPQGFRYAGTNGEELPLDLQKEIFIESITGLPTVVRNVGGIGAALRDGAVHIDMEARARAKEKRDREAALPVAAGHGDVDAVRRLLSEGVDADTTDQDGIPCLGHAVQAGNGAIVEMLLRAGARVNAEDGKHAGFTALQLAAQNGRIDIVRMLRNAGGIIATRQLPMCINHFLRAAAHGKSEVVQAWMLAGIDANADQEMVSGTALVLAAHGGHIGTVQALLNAGTRVNLLVAKAAGSALGAAAHDNHGDIVRLLLKAGADPNIVDKLRAAPVLKVPVVRGYHDVVALLLRAGARVDETDLEGVTALMWAADLGDLDMARTLLACGANVNRADLYGRRPLHFAALRGHTPVVKLLLQKGADPHAVDWENNSAIQCAAHMGHREIVQVLAAAGASGNVAPMALAVTPQKALFIAIVRNDSELAGTVLKSNIDVDAPDDNGWTALMTAARRGNRGLVKMLVSAGANLNAVNQEYGATALMLAVKFGHVDVVKQLITHGTDLNLAAHHGTTALEIAEREEQPEIARLLRTAGAIEDECTDAPVAPFHDAPLFYAVVENKPDAVEEALQKGANLNATDINGSTALLHAVSLDSDAVAEILVRHGADVNRADLDGRRPLSLAAKAGRRKLVQTLLKAGAEPHALGIQGISAIVEAAAAGQREIAQLLSTAGAGMNAPIRPPQTRTARGLGNVIQLADRHTLSRLLETAVDVNAPDDNGYTPLMIAARCGHADIVQTLLDKGADVDAVDATHGLTALMLASKAGKPDVVKLLVARGANVKRIASHGKTALKLAEHFGHEEVVKLLRAAGAA
jgi:ankyrin repeat protein